MAGETSSRLAQTSDTPFESKENKESLRFSKDEKARLLECLRQYGKVGCGYERKMSEKEVINIRELSDYRRKLLIDLLEEDIGYEKELLERRAQVGHDMFVWTKFTDREYRILEGRGQGYGIHRFGDNPLLLIYNGCYINIDQLWNNLPKDDKKWREDKEKREKMTKELLERHGGKRNCGNCKNGERIWNYNVRCHGRWHRSREPHRDNHCCGEHKFIGEDD